MNDEEVLGIFKQAGAVLDGHFLLTSGLHSPLYWEKFRVLQFPEHVSKLCAMIADHYKNEKIQIVAGPTTGGIILAFEVAKLLGVRSVFAEKEGTTRTFRRGFSIDPEQRVLVVDDILTTGGSVIEVIKAVRKLNANVVGVGVLVDRSELAIDLDAPLFSCLKSSTRTYKPEECPLCSAGVPLVRLGG